MDASQHTHLSQPLNAERDWGPQPSRLLESLQTFSDSLMRSLEETSAQLDKLATASVQANVSLANITNRFELLSFTHFVEQKVQDTSHLLLALDEGDEASAQHNVVITPANFKEVVFPQYVEALALGAESMTKPLDTRPYDRPLPYLYGSPEYLQDDDVGLGSFWAGARYPAPRTTQELLDRAASRTHSGSFRSTSQLHEVESVPGSLDQAAPDFMSMLDLALKGELQGLPDEHEDDLNSEALIGGRWRAGGSTSAIGGGGQPLSAQDLGLSQKGLFDDDDDENNCDDEQAGGEGVEPST